MLAPFGVDIVSAGELGLPAPDETGTTFEANATLKALAATRASGLPALADDSGLSVHALDHQPGVYTADWEGPTRDAMVGMRRIQDELAERGVPHTDAARAPRPSIACWRWPGPTSIVELFHGTLDGSDRLAAARHRRPRLRSLLPAERRHAHDGGDVRRGEERHQPSRTRLPDDGRGQLRMSAAPLGVYVHWPFCKSKCPYCDFNSHVRDGVEQARWREALLASWSTPRARRRAGGSRRCSSAAARPR